MSRPSSAGDILGATININYGSFALMQPRGTADLGEGPMDLGQTTRT